MVKPIIPQDDFNVIKQLIDAARQRAVQAVNTSLIELYWQVGKTISLKIEQAEWGDGGACLGLGEEKGLSRNARMVTKRLGSLLLFEQLKEIEAWAIPKSLHEKQIHYLLKSRLRFWILLLF
jgi:hypothetical protein